MNLIEASEALSNNPRDAVTSTFTSKTSDRQELMAMLRKDCSQALQKYEDGVRILRMVETSNHTPAYIADSRLVERRSANTFNYYTWIVDNDPAWKHIPKRSKSFICSINHSYMTAGRQYIVFPYNNTTVAYIPEMDFWQHFQNEMPWGALDNFNIFLDELMVAAMIEGERADDATSNAVLRRERLRQRRVSRSKMTYMDFRKELLSIQRYLQTFKTFKDFVDAYGKPSSRGGLEAMEAFYKHREDVLALLRKWLSPSRVETSKIAQLEGQPNHGSECWFSGEAIFIREDLFEDVFLKTK